MNDSGFRGTRACVAMRDARKNATDTGGELVPIAWPKKNPHTSYFGLPKHLTYWGTWALDQAHGLATALGRLNIAQRTYVEGLCGPKTLK